MNFKTKITRHEGFYTPPLHSSPWMKRNINNVQLTTSISNVRQNKFLKNKSCFEESANKNFKYLNSNLKTLNNPLRISQTLDGKTKYICNSASQTREHWLQSARKFPSNLNQIKNKQNWNEEKLDNNLSTKFINLETYLQNKQNNYIDQTKMPINCEQTKLDNMKLFELTENEFILSSYDPRFHLNSKINFKENDQLYKNMENWNALPVYQSIEENNQIFVKK